jgi:hypothetical protein
MQVKTLILTTLCIATAPVMGWTIPEGQADGVYAVSLVNNTHVHTKLGEIPSVVKRRALGRILPRDGLDATYCASDTHELNHADTDSANAGMAEQCQDGRSVPHNEAVYAIRNNVVAFACNNGETYSATCITWVHQQAQGMVTAKCGWYKGGWAYDHGAHISYGYQSYPSTYCS